MLPVPTYAQPPRYQDPLQNGTFVAIEEPILTNIITQNSFFTVGQMHNDMCVLLRYHTEQFYCLKPSVLCLFISHWYLFKALKFILICSQG